MRKRFLVLGTLSGALAVSLGAFGAHGLKKIVSAETVSIFQTGVQYQMYHTLALLLAGIAYDQFNSQWMRWAGYLFCCGIVFFSGSLYLITALNAMEKRVPVFIGMLTPLGGVSFICGWLCFLAAAYKMPSSQGNR